MYNLEVDGLCGHELPAAVSIYICAASAGHLISPIKNICLCTCVYLYHYVFHVCVFGFLVLHFSQDFVIPPQLNLQASAVKLLNVF